MYVQRRFPFKSVLVWTSREIIFFTIFATIITVLYELLGIKWLQVPLAPVALIGTAVAFMVGFQNNAAYDRIWEARKIWGGIVNSSRSLIITVKDSFYMHRSEAKQDESEELNGLCPTREGSHDAKADTMLKTDHDDDTQQDASAMGALGAATRPRRMRHPMFPHRVSYG